MATYLKMPKLSDTMTEGKISEWFKSEGDSVDIDEDVAAIETDKATMDWQSPVMGVLHKIYVGAGESATLGQAIAMVLEEGEEPPEGADQPPADESSAAEEEDDGANDDKEAPSDSEPAKSPPSPSGAASKAPSAKAPETSSSGRRVKASPLARKMAQERGIDLDRVKGSGPGGRVVSEDLDYAAQGGSGGGIGIGPVFPRRGDETIQLSGMRKVIAQRLLESKTTIPHFYLNMEVDAGPLMSLRGDVNEASQAKGGPKYTVNDFVMRAVVLASQEKPEVNASFRGDSIVQFGSVNLSVAVAIEGGLVTPVIFDAQDKSMADLSAEIKDLAARARDRKLTPDEMQGGTITISNLGSYGVHSFDAIINPPQAAILSIGTISKQAVVDDRGEIVPGLRMWIGMSCDHRVIDGAVGAEFMAALKNYRESPVL